MRALTRARRLAVQHNQLVAVVQKRETAQAPEPGTCAACRTKVQVQTVFCDETEVGAAKGGENLRLRLSGIDEDDVQAGFVVCDPHVVVPVVTYFEAQLQVTTVCIVVSAVVLAVARISDDAA